MIKQIVRVFKLPFQSFKIGMFLLYIFSTSVFADRKPVNALYIPLADHYAAIIAFEKYRDEMKFADFSIEKMSSWDLLRAKYMEGENEMAFVMSPLAISMYQDKPNFKWIGLMHRDGNGLAVTHKIAHASKIAFLRNERLPNRKIELTDQTAFDSNTRLLVGVPHIQSTHSVVLYRYLKQHGLSISFTPNLASDVLAIPIPPPMSPAFVLGNSNRNRPVGIEQSLPWIDLIESDGHGQVVWYSKDVIPTKLGHVECIALATKQALSDKKQAVSEVFHYIKKAGADIEKARMSGNDEIDDIVTMIQKHIPAHTSDAIYASLNPQLRIINYENLDIDKPGLKLIMDTAIEARLIKDPIDLDQFAQPLTFPVGPNHE